MVLPIYFDPGIAVADLLDYSWDWTDWLEPDDTIESASVSGAPSGLTISDALVVGAVVTAWVSGATLNTYVLTCQIVTAQGRTANRSANLVCSAL